MNILVTSAGQRVSLVRAFKKELKNKFPNGKVFTVDLNPVLAPACHVSDGYEKISKVTEDRYIDELIGVCKMWEIKIIIPTIDTELKILSENKRRFKEQGVSVIVSDIEFVSKCRDKRLINQFFIAHNIDIPQKIDKENPSFPLFIKPYDGSRSIDTFLIQNQKELTDYHYKNKKFMFMEYMDPKENDEYTVDTYYDKNHNLKCVVPRKRIFVRSGEVNKGVTHNNEIVDCIKNKLTKIEGAVGCLTMQFFFNAKTKRIVGIEINPRFGGGYPLSYLAGANFPKWLIEEYCFDKSLSFFNEWETNLLMLRYDDEVLVHNYEK